MKPVLKKILFIIVLFSYSPLLHAQEELDIVNPYEIKASRSKTADTFYFTQNALPVVAAPKLDTLRSYNVFLEERPTPFGMAYLCNGMEVSKQKYLEYKRYWNASSACKPCLLYTFDGKDQLKYVAYQYQDCLCGAYTEYYSDGEKKLEGQFKENSSGNWETMTMSNHCNVRQGTWTYYTPNGTVEKIETYVDGKLKEVSTMTNATTMDEPTPSKTLFQRDKNKTKTKDN